MSGEARRVVLPTKAQNEMIRIILARPVQPGAVRPFFKLEAPSGVDNGQWRAAVTHGDTGAIGVGDSPHEAVARMLRAMKRANQ